MESLKALKKVREKKLFIDFELDTTIGEEVDEELDIIQKDLEILEILMEDMFFQSYYVNQANWNSEYISMYIDKRRTKPEIYNKVKEWCFKNKIRGTENANKTE